MFEASPQPKTRLDVKHAKGGVPGLKLGTALLGVVLLLPALMASSLGHWLAHAIGANASATISADKADAQQ